MIKRGFAFQYAKKYQEILYCFAEGNYWLIYLSSGKKITSAKPLKLVEKALIQSMFVRINHSYIINIYRIQIFQNKPEPKVTMTDGKKLTISFSTSNLTSLIRSNILSEFSIISIFKRWFVQLS